MAKLRKAWQCAMYTFLENNLRPVMITAILVLWVYIGERAVNIRQFVISRAEPINLFGAYVWLLSNTEAILVLGIVIILTMSKAPFLNEAQQNILIRAGQPSWLIGQIIYIAMTVAMLMLGALVILMLVLAPNITFTGGWGKVINTMVSYPDLVWENFPSAIVQYFTPVTAFLSAFGLRWACYTLCVLLIFFLNLFIKARPGVLAALAILVFDGLTIMLPYKTWICSVSTMSRLDVLLKAPNPNYPDVLPAMILLFGSLLLLSVGIAWIGRRADIGKMTV